MQPVMSVCIRCWWWWWCWRLTGAFTITLDFKCCWFRVAVDGKQSINDNFRTKLRRIKLEISRNCVVGKARLRPRTGKYWIVNTRTLYDAQGPSLRGWNTPPATLAQKGKIVWSGRREGPCLVESANHLKMPRAPPTRSRKATQTPHAWAYLVCTWYLVAFAM